MMLMGVLQGMNERCVGVQTNALMQGGNLNAAWARSAQPR